MRGQEFSMEVPVNINYVIEDEYNTGFYNHTGLGFSLRFEHIDSFTTNKYEYEYLLYINDIHLGDCLIQSDYTLKCFIPSWWTLTRSSNYLGIIIFSMYKIDNETYSIYTEDVVNINKYVPLSLYWILRPDGNSSNKITNSNMYKNLTNSYRTVTPSVTAKTKFLFKFPFIKMSYSTVADNYNTISEYVKEYIGNIINTTTTTPKVITSYIPTTTSYIPTTTSYIPTTTSYIPTTTSYIPTTKIDDTETFNVSDFVTYNKTILYQPVDHIVTQCISNPDQYATNLVISNPPDNVVTEETTCGNICPIKYHTSTYAPVFQLYAEFMFNVTRIESYDNCNVLDNCYIHSNIGITFQMDYYKDVDKTVWQCYCNRYAVAWCAKHI